MSLTLGKRKRATTSKPTLPSKKPTIAKPAPPPPVAVEPASDTEDREALNDAFRRAFEKRFKAIEEDKPEETQSAEAEEPEPEDEDWDGISEAEDDDDDEEDAVEVVEHDMSTFSRNRADKAALKAFMSSKPPSSSSAPTNPIKSSKQKEAEDTNDQDDLKNDLALQRLLKESHLLDASSLTTDPTGKNRHKATDLRLLSLGSKTSIFAQKNMPKDQRLGIQRKKIDKEVERRREARENGIVLERVTKGAEGRGGASAGKRERGIGNPSVGRFSGGTLRLSKRDVEGITGPKGSGRGGKGGRGRGGGRGGKRR